MSRLAFPVIIALLFTMQPPPVEAAAPLVSPSGAGTVVIGPQAMEGNLQIHPGDTLRAGFDFTMPGSHPAATVSFYSGYVSLLVKCADGSSPPLTIQLPSQTITDPAGSPSWYPSGDQSSSLVYQGTLTAPNLCSGGVMNDAAGAIFTTTFFSTDTLDKVNFRFHYSDNTSGSWSATIQGIPTPFAKTVTSATLTPTLSLGLSSDHASAIPGDTINYTATVTNSGATLSVGGDFLASATGSGTATVVSYWDDIYTSLDGSSWSPFVGTAGTNSGYTPTVAPPSASGLSLSLTSVAATGVTYPSSGDPILLTSISSGSTAQWHYIATAVLSATQAAALFDPTKVKKIRNSFHLEVTPANPNVAQPAIVNLDFSNLFYGGGASASLSNVNVTIQPPQGAAALQFNSGNTPALATLSSGASASVSGSYRVPVAAAKGSGQADSSYFAALTALEGAMLKATASASATATTGTVNASVPPPVTTIEHLPIVSIAKSGPPSVTAGTTETNPLAFSNSGGAAASGLSVIDSVPNGATGTVTGVPATLAAGASASASATFPVPGAQQPGNLTDTAALTWQDANGNSYGPVSSSFTTTVTNPFAGASLTLAPTSAGPNVPGATQALTATLLDSNKHPIANQTVSFTVTGANPASGTAITDLNGNAVFSYVGINVGNDVAQATFTAPGTTINSNTSTINWTKLLQTAAASIVQGNFYTNPSNSCTFDIGSGATPVFGQTFPDILFNPATSVVPHDISNVGNFTRPFTDLTVDVNGNYNGQIVAQGNGQQAGVGSLENFYGVFTGTFVVSQPGDLTFRILHDDGYIIGVGGGATRVNGDFEGNPPANTPFNNYPVVAAFNGGSSGASSSGPATVHFPAAGIYPYELDYTECGSGALFLNLLTEQFVAQTNPLAIYVGYADALRAGGSAFPFPWDGSPNTNFFGCPGCPYDAGAIRFDNNSASPLTFDSITVDVGGNHFDLWPHAFTLPAGQLLILTMTVNDNFDTSDFSGSPCNVNNGVIPLVNVTIAGKTTAYKDTNQVLNTGGFDLACLRNESLPWRSISGSGNAINLPVPPAASLAISPFKVTNALLGQTQTLTVSTMDGAGNPVANLLVTLQVFGPNARTLTATSSASGLAIFTYTGTAVGTDSIQASAFITGLRAISNLGSVVWSVPFGGGPNPAPNPDPNAPPPPNITSPSPADGSLVTKPVAVSATITPPANQTITSWRVLYQALDPGPVITLASGTGTPPATLATFDPTVLPNDTYGITIEATASGGGVQDLTTTVTVFGNLKLGRYVTTYQDLSVPVNGFQMEVRRTYDSIDKSSGDFGVGWRVSVSNFRVAPNRILGAAGWTQYNSSCSLGLCFTAFKNSASRFVTVTFPDQHVEVFDFTPQGGTNLFWGCTPQFTARASTGTTSTLQPVDDTACSYVGDGNLYGSNGLYSPNRFKLTTHDGMVLILDRTLGLVSETDRNGNALNVDGTGVHSSSAQSITFSRDGSGRITKITGPSGETFAYTFSASGDLATSTDPNGNQTTYSYDSTHDLLRAAGGAQPAETLQYDASGRLISITDAAGNIAQLQNDVPGQKQTVIDAAGQLTTLYTYDDLGDVVRLDKIAGGQVQTSTATYDAIGRPLTRTDALGHTWQAGYDSSGNPTSMQTPLKNGLTVVYDSFGAPTSATDPLGDATTFVYDARGNTSSATNALNQTDTYTYDAQGHVTSHTDALGKTWKYGYDSFGHNTSITDPLGNTTTQVFDASGRLTSTQDALGNTDSYTYDLAGNLTSAKDALSNVSSYTYNTQEKLSSRSDALGNKTTYVYDSLNRLASVTDPLGGSTTYTYDADGRILSVTQPTGGTMTYTYDGFGQLISEKDPLGRMTGYSYDAAGRLSSRTMPNGGTYTYAYDNDGRATSVIDPLGHSRKAVYDAAGRMVKSIDALGNATSYTLDALGRATVVTDPLQQTTDHSYDAAGRLVTDTDAAGRTTTYGYDAAGNLISVTDPLGHTTAFRYDQDNRVSARVDALQRTSSNRYDPVGRITSRQLPSGITTTTTYDALGRVIATNDGLHGTAYTFDAAGRQVSMTDPRGNTTTYAYDAAGRQISVTDALGGKVTTAYDLAGQKTSTVNARGDKTTFAYDALGNLQAQTDPAGNATTYAYDLAGRQTSQTDARGVVVTSAYDAADHLTGITFPGGSIALTYDVVGRRTAMTDATGTTNFSYDATARLTSVAAPQGTVAYGYDAAGNRISMSVSGRGTINYAYDATNQLTTLTDFANQRFTFTYAPDGMPASITRPGNVVSTFGYDGADRLTSLHHDGPSGPIAHYDYTLDADGNRTSMTSAAGSETYTTDALNRLTAVSYPNGDSATYSYDSAGNRLTSTVNGSTTNYAYDSVGRLVSQGGKTITYDAAGNVTSIGSDTFSWDWAGRLSSSTVGGVTSSYTYDGQGIRVAMATAGSTTNYTWDRAGSLPLLVDDGKQAYVQLDTGLLEQLGNATTYPLSDALGSVRTLETSTASVAGATSYDAFGSVRSQNGSQSIFGFSGQQSDPTGLAFLRARYYNPTQGRFMSPDSLQPNAPGTQGYDLYSYVANNPTSAVDPTGQFADVVPAYLVPTRAAPGFAALGLAIEYTVLLAVIALTLLNLECAVGLPPCAVAPAPATDTADKPIDEPRPPTEQQKWDWRALAKEAIKACLITGAAGLGLCRPPANTFVPGQDQGAVTSHDFKAILNDQPFYLTYTRKLNNMYRCDVAARNFSCWYDWQQFQPNACLGSSSNRGGKQCDEYPFLSTAQGGPPASKDGSPPGTSLMPVSVDDNQAQGTWLSRFYGPKPTGCGIQNSPDNPIQGGFLVIADIVPLPLSTQYYCGDFNR